MAVNCLPSTACLSSCPSADVDDEGFLRFLRSFGDLQFTEGETPVPGVDELNVISNVGRTTPPRSTFHTDTSYVRNPPAYTALRAVDRTGAGRPDVVQQPVPGLPHPAGRGSATSSQAGPSRDVVTGLDPRRLSGVVRGAPDPSASIRAPGVPRCS